jgi:flagellar biosynthesis/type III secretory pathway chaperone
MDKKLKEAFLSALEKQTALYKKLNDVIKSEQKILVSKDAKGLNAVINQKEEIIGSIKALELDKLSIFEKMAVSMGLKFGPELKLFDMLKKAGDEDASEIERGVAVLIKIAAETGRINAGNTVLMKNFIQYTGFIGALMEKSKVTDRPLYTPEGINNIKVDQKHTFDQKI